MLREKIPKEMLREKMLENKSPKIKLYLLSLFLIFLALGTTGCEIIVIRILGHYITEWEARNVIADWLQMRCRSYTEDYCRLVDFMVFPPGKPSVAIEYIGCISDYSEANRINRSYYPCLIIYPKTNTWEIWEELNLHAYLF